MEQQDEPLVNFDVGPQSEEYEFLVDTGADRSSLRKLPTGVTIGTKTCEVLWAEGRPFRALMIEGVEIKGNSKYCVADFLYLPHTETNLLGRDLQVQLGVGVIPKDGKMVVHIMKLTQGDIQEINPEVWATEGKDGCLDIPPIKIEMQKDTPTIRVKQYPMSPEGKKGLASVIEHLLKENILEPCMSPHNTPILAIKKDEGKFRLVQDLREINKRTIAQHPVVPNPYTLLSKIPREHTWFTLIDLKDAFWACPLAEECRDWFAFEWEHPDRGRKQQLRWTRLPQGYTESPNIFGQALETLLEQFSPKEGVQILQYVDDLLISEETEKEVKDPFEAREDYWEAPNHLFWICGDTAYTKLPGDWSGSCTIGIIKPAFFLLPKRLGSHLGVPVYDNLGKVERKKRDTLTIGGDQNWKGKIWTPEEIIKTFGPATWAQDGSWGYRTPIYMLNRIIRLQAVLEMIASEYANKKNTGILRMAQEWETLKSREPRWSPGLKSHFKLVQKCCRAELTPRCPWAEPLLVTATGPDPSRAPGLHSQSEEMPNSSSISHFLLLALADTRQLQLLHFCLFLGISLAALLGNSLIISAVACGHHLHTPMFFFLLNLALTDLGSILTTVPKAMHNSLWDTRNISYTGCAAQVFFFMFFISAEFYLLTIMSYDRYVSICKPLHYGTLLGSRACAHMAAAAWASTFLNALMHTANTFSLPLCHGNALGQFFCEIPQILKLSCSHSNLRELGLLAVSVCLAFGCFVFIVFSYVQIFRAVLRIPSEQGRHKAFSTCLPHLAVVSLFISTGFFAYLKPPSIASPSLDLSLSILYSVCLQP
ncbi:hypothetical protein DUI87_23603 [Hirundo rustica rustica]|uniref:ribonuclease H n=1 Tax=Hirundo rustica rustica TaxID=333673 RepID=A0A3M0JY09_HIRRU|nr:hypothetical protein DUI87_23603 [Hirundo rustica rustica]